MFEQTFVNAQAQTRRPWTVGVSVLLQASLIAVALIAPLLHVAKLEAPPKVPFFFQVEKVDLNVKPEVQAAPHRLTAPKPFDEAFILRAPTAVPTHIDMSPDAPQITSSSVGAGPADTPLNGLVHEITAQPVVKPVPPTPPAPAHVTAPVQVGGDVEASRLLFGPKPPYPPLAKATRTQGTVRIQANIGRDGSIRNLQLIGGPPLLVTAALEAVKQWRYKPTLLNGEPVEVITEITVNFMLSGQ
jgi:periplasmic protein TonB